MGALGLTKDLGPKNPAARLVEGEERLISLHRQIGSKNPWDLSHLSKIEVLIPFPQYKILPDGILNPLVNTDPVHVGRPYGWYFT